MKIEDVVYEFVKQLRLRNYAIDSIKVYESCIRKFIYHFKGHKPNKSDIEDYLLELKSSTYKKHTLSAIKNFNRFVMKGELDVEEIPNPKIESRLPDILAPSEIQRLISVIENLKHKVITILLYSTGMRVGEIIKLKWKDIDRERMVINIRQGKGAKDRQSPLNEKVLQLLEIYCKEYELQKSIHVFRGQGNAEQYTAKSIQEFLNRYALKAKLKKKVHPHKLRHSAFTEMFNQGTDSKLIKEISGHKSDKMLDRYLHLSTKNISKVKSPIADINF